MVQQLASLNAQLSNDALFEAACKEFSPLSSLFLFLSFFFVSVSFLTHKFRYPNTDIVHHHRHQCMMQKGSEWIHASKDSEQNSQNRSLSYRAWFYSIISDNAVWRTFFFFIWKIILFYLFIYFIYLLIIWNFLFHFFIIFFSTCRI